MDTLARRKLELIRPQSVVGDNKHAIVLGQTPHSCRDTLVGMAGMGARTPECSGFLP